MTTPNTPSPVIRHYFVDEAGDPTLFGKQGKILVGSEGCSKYFILGKLDVENVPLLASELTGLRMKLLADPYFQGVPSMQPERRKTAIALHAKDDLPEVRREVFKLLMAQKVQFFAVVRDKAVITTKVIEHNKKRPKYRYHPNQLYDRCVSRLFKERHTRMTVIRSSSRAAGSRIEPRPLRRHCKRHEPRFGVVGALPGLHRLKLFQAIQLKPSVFRRSITFSGHCSDSTKWMRIGFSI
jgi:hypothetical protein